MKRLMTILILTAIISGTLLVSACSDSGSDAAGLEDTVWVLDSYGASGNPQDVIEGSRVTATFNSKDGQVTGTASCNHYFGSYELKGGLSVGMIGSTEMYCGEPEGIMDQETEYLKLLGMAKDFTIEKNTLTIDCGDSILIFSLETAE